MAMFVAFDSYFRQWTDRHRRSSSRNNACEFSSRLMRGLRKSTAWFVLLSHCSARGTRSWRRRSSSSRRMGFDRSGADLSRPAARHSEPAADRRAHRSRRGPTRSISRPKDRSAMRCARYCRSPRPAVHHELHDALSRIYLRARADPGEPDLRGVAAFSRRRHRNDGGNAVADERTARARIFQSRHVDAWRRHRTVPARSRHRSRAFRGRSSSALGRVAVEKNLDAFLSLDLPGTKVVIGKGPMEARAEAPLSRKRNFSDSWKTARWRRISPRPMYSCFQA